MDRKFVIGDIHGRYEALKEVIFKSKFDYEKDKLIVLGDAVDGGINSYKVIEELLKIKHLVFIIGNHDEWFINHIKSGWAEEIWIQQGGANTLKSYGAKVKESETVSDESLIDTSNLKIPLTHQIFFNNGKYWYEEDNCMFVHGGFRAKLHPKEETRHNLVWGRYLINVARLYHKTGQKIGKWDKVFVGHTTTQLLGNSLEIEDCMRPLKFANLIMMDCGAGYDGKLAIMDINSEDYWVSKVQNP
jgi:serine/threonine protein phosphatase 1